ncbi:MAG: O-antigen polymerase [Acidobacteriota bacterium]|nr:O-antigen polymerase [Acidobacteriota bacterium]
MIVTLTLLLLIGGCLLSRLLFRDFATPPGIYIFVWSVTVLLLQLNLVDYHAVHSAWWAVLLSGVCFLAGSVAGICWGLPFPKPRPEPNLDSEKLRRIMPLLFILGLIGFGLQLAHLQRTVGLATFIIDPPLARKLHSHLFAWGYLNLLNMVNYVIAVLYLITARKRRLLPLLMTATAIASALMTTDRTRLYFMIFWGFFLWIYTTGGFRMSLRKNLRSAVLALTLLVFFMLFASHFQRQYGPKYPQYLSFPPETAYLADPYIYLTGNIPALQALLDDDIEHTDGRFSFAPLTNLLSRFLPVEPVPLQGKLYFVPVELNTYSYLQQFYVDWGWPGMVAGPFFCGLLAGLCYAYMRRRPGFLSLYLASLAAWCCLISVFVNFFTQEATWFFVAVGLLLHPLLQVPRMEPQPGEGCIVPTQQANT